MVSEIEIEKEIERDGERGKHTRRDNKRQG